MALVLGSGWGQLTSDWTVLSSLPFSEVPHYPIPRVEGHRGRLLMAKAGSAEVLVLEGRVHLYEGYSAEEVAYPVSSLARWGVETVVLTNASGAVNPALQVGQLVAIADHINFQATQPLSWGPSSFLDLTRLYDPELRAMCRQVAVGRGLPLQDAVYLGVTGPHFETPAEIRAFRALGADIVGMSTIQESIALRQYQKRVLGLSLVSNLGAGIGPEPIDHTSVLETGQASVRRYRGFLQTLVERLLAL